MNCETLYCDNCGVEGATCPVTELPCDIDSANKGESAILCSHCHEQLIVPEQRRIKYEVEVFVGEDAVRVYLVEGPEGAEDEALEVALEAVRDIVGGEVTAINYPDAVAAIDYDGELTL